MKMMISYHQQAHPLIKNQLKLDQNPKNLKELDQSLKARNKLLLTQLTLKKRTKIQLRKESLLILSQRRQLLKRKEQIPFHRRNYCCENDEMILLVLENNFILQ
jgi:hypothetical protein